MKDDTPNLFYFNQQGHAIFKHRGFKFIQHQKFDNFYYQGKLTRQDAIPMSTDAPIKFAFWGGDVLTKAQIIERVGA